MKIFKKIIVFILIISFSFYAIAEEVDSLTDLKNEFNNLKEQLNENIFNLPLSETETEKAFDQSMQALLSDIENITNDEASLENINIYDELIILEKLNDNIIQSLPDQFSFTNTAVNLLDLADYSLGEVMKFLPQKYENDLSNVNIEELEREKIETISEISSASKINKQIKAQEFQANLFKLENNNFDTQEYFEILNNDGIPTEGIKINLKDLETMENWTKKEWANAYTQEIPKEIMDDAGNVVETLNDENIQDIKAQLALTELQDLSSNFEEISRDLSQSNINIAESLDASNFTVTLDKYDQFYQMWGWDDFQQVVDTINEDYWGTSFSADEIKDIIETGSVPFDPSIQDLSLIEAIDTVNTEGLGFDAGQLAAEIGMELQEVAETIANATAAEVSVDIEALAQGLGFASFADAVAAYNAQYGSNFTVKEAIQNLGLE